MFTAKATVTSKVLHNVCLRSLGTANGKKFDVVVVGGGIVGVASARELLLRRPGLKVAVLEKENHLAGHQSGHNSGVIHAGIYYKPGSLKAKLCVEGLNLSYKYFDEKDIPYKKCGKLIVATDIKEIPALEELYKRGLMNNVKDLEMIDGDQIGRVEPHCRGVQALWSPHTGIVDWALVTRVYAQDFERAGGSIFTSFELNEFSETAQDKDYPVTCHSKGDRVRTKFVLACCGLHSDQVATLSGCSPNPMIIPFRGEYLTLNPRRTNLVRGNIYPVPDPRFPFLGVHFTPRMDGSVLLGPNAVLALRREGYNWKQINLKDLFGIITYPGFRKLAVKYARFGFTEMVRSFNVGMQLKELRKYIPELLITDLHPGPAGVRAQAMGVDGSLIEDFVFDCQKDKGIVSSRILHCRNAPSPGATSSLAIAKMIADKMETEFNI